MTENKIIRVYCTNCDINMVYNGIALDCPIDGTFYICKKCNHRIVIFIQE